MLSRPRLGAFLWTGGDGNDEPVTFRGIFGDGRGMLSRPRLGAFLWTGGDGNAEPATFRGLFVDGRWKIVKS